MKAGARRLLAPALLLALAWFLYTFNLTAASLVGDDEGMNLYPAWRVSLGERLYRDVAFDHTPIAIQLGALLFRFTGPSALAAKKLTIVFSLLAAFFAYLLAEQILGQDKAILALALLVTDAYWHFFGWFFTSDAYFLCFYMASLYLFARAWVSEDRPSTWFLSGMMAGFAVWSKLFGVFAFGGGLLFLAIEFFSPARVNSRRGRIARAAGWFLAGGAVASVLFVLPMLTYFDRFLELTVLHHRKAVQTLSAVWVLYSFFDVLWFKATPIAHKLLLILGLAGVFARDKRPNALRGLLVCHLAQAGVFLFVHLEFYARHLLFTLPLLCIFAASQLGELARERGEPRRIARWLGTWMFLSALLSFSAELPGYGHGGTVELVQKLAGPGETILAEHWDVPFLAQRRNVPLRDVPASGNDPKKGAFRLSATELVLAIEREKPSLVLLLEKPSQGEDFHFKGQIADEPALLQHLQSQYRTLDTTESAGYQVFIRK